jgi:hypothetical protein|tara:strand:- start:654 stop:2063 length:1410 start_codon:yes stop_codon:yes gene_type:complete
MGQTWSNKSIWEVRTTGSDTNGGAFIWNASGSDYSQQNSPQYSGTDLEVNSSNNLQVKSTTAGSPVAADVGNVICISAGTFWTTGWYEIQSQDGTWWTLDRSPNAAGSTGGTFAVGGALASPGLAVDIGEGYYASNNRRAVIYIESGTYTISTSTSFTSGTYLNGPRSSYFGYDQTNGRNQRPTTNPLLQNDSSYSGTILDIHWSTNASYMAGEVSWIDCDGGGYGGTVVDRPSAMYQSTIQGGTTAQTAGGSYFDCKILGDSCGSYKKAANGGGYFYCYIDAQGGGFRGSAFSGSGFGNVIVGSTNNGGNQYYVATTSRQGYMLNNIIVAKSGAAFPQMDGTFFNNLMLAPSSGRYLFGSGFTGGTSDGHWANNYYYGFTGGTPSYVGRDGFYSDPVALSADPCVDLAGGDYTLDPSSAAFSTLRQIPDLTKPYGFGGGGIIGPGVDVTTISGGGSTVQTVASIERLK